MITRQLWEAILLQQSTYLRRQSYKEPLLVVTVITKHLKSNRHSKACAKKPMNTIDRHRIKVQIFVKWMNLKNQTQWTVARLFWMHTTMPLSGRVRQPISSSHHWLLTKRSSIRRERGQSQVLAPAYYSTTKLRNTCKEELLLLGSLSKCTLRMSTPRIS